MIVSFLSTCSVFAGVLACLIMLDVNSIQIDCSHGNSEKQHKRQIDVAEDIVRQEAISSTYLLNKM